jgi:predicted PurR-regulated permease PerM
MREIASNLGVVALLLIGILLCYFLSIPFIPAFVWSLTLSIVLQPVHSWVKSLIRSPSLAALLASLMIGVMVVGPAIFVIVALLDEAARSASLVAPMIQDKSSADALANYPWLARSVRWINAELDLPNLVQAMASALAQWSGTLVKSSFAGGLNFVLTFYFLFYLLRDKERILAAAMDYLPLTDAEFAQVRTRAADTIIAIFWGTIAVAGLQGALGGAMFWWLGLPAPVFWGFLMGLLAIVPFLGAFVIWAPAAIYLALVGQYTSALLLAGWGILVVGVVDNLVYPVLVGNRLRLHTVMAFVAVVGGVIVFGAQGLVLGPLIVSLSLTFAEMWKRRVTERSALQTGSQ